MLSKDVYPKYILAVSASFALAVLFHFLYGWFPSIIISLIAPVNESVFEHVKLFYVPALLVYLFLYKSFGKYYPNYLTGILASILIMPIIMFVLYFIYRSFLPDLIVFDILITIIVLLIGFLISFRISISDKNYILIASFVFNVIGVMFLLYAYLTYNPPKTKIFEIDDTGIYGVHSTID